MTRLRLPCPSGSAAIWAAFLIIAVLPLLLACGLTPRSTEPNQPRLFLRYAEERSADYPATAAGREFAANVEQRTLGAIRVQVYDAGKLGNEASVVEQLRFGGIDLARLSIRALGDVSPTALQLGLPGAVASTMKAQALMEGSIGQQLAAELLAQKLVLLAWYDGGPDCYLMPSASLLAETSSPLRIGVEPSRALMDLATAKGLTPIPLAMSDFRHARDTGLAVAFWLPLLAAESEHLLDGLYPLIDFDSRVLELIVASRVIFQKILPKDREALLEAARKTWNFHNNYREAAETQLLARFKD